MTRIFSLLALAIVCTSAASAASAPTGRIVFVSSSGVGGKTQIWVVNANGTRRHALSPSVVNEEGAAVSRDGKRIAFLRRGDVYVMGTSGGHVRRLTFSAAVEGAPAWSGDGRWIAYSLYRSGRSDIWKMRPDGSSKTRLTKTAVLEDVPAWSPDSRRIAYAGPQAQIWVMNADGSGQRAVTHTRSGRGVNWAPSWSPDGRRIAYESDVDTGLRDLTNEVWVMNADGSRPVRLTNNKLADNHPVWSPDGDWLAFSSSRPKPGVTHLWLMRPNGKGLHRVTSWAGEQYWPSWAR